MRLLICAGGTGGGVYPALAVLQELNKSRNLFSGNHVATSETKRQEDSLLWVGGEGSIESDLVRRAGIPFEAIPAAGVHGVGVKALPGNVVKLIKGYFASRKIISRYKPDVLFFTGGYVAIPVGLASRLFSSVKPRPRILLFVPDIEPGLALKTLTYLADHITLSTEHSLRYLPAQKTATYTGYPVREQLKTWGRSQALNHFGLQGDMPILLVFGGSTGARTINRALLDALPKLLLDIQVLHVSGQRDWEEVQQRIETISSELRSRYRTYPYLHEDMGAAMKVADLVVSRAGAAVLGEYPQFGLPAILVPYPHAWRYQHTNAEYLVHRGGAVLLEDADLIDQLLLAVLDLINDPDKLASMKEAMNSLATPNSTKAIADILQNLSLSYGELKDVKYG